MSSTINITLFILTAQKELVEPLFDRESHNTLGHYVYRPDNVGTFEDTTHFTFYENRSEQLDFLPELISMGIPFDNIWEDEMDVSGSIHQRFTSNGESVYKELMTSESNPEITSLLDRINKPEALREFILDHQASRCILPWDNQARYGELYRARRLIHAT